MKKTVEITAPFTGYPDGTKRDFATGEKPALDGDYADMLIGKKLAESIKTKRPATPVGKED